MPKWFNKGWGTYSPRAPCKVTENRCALTFLGKCYQGQELAGASDFWVWQPSVATQTHSAVQTQQAERWHETTFKAITGSGLCKMWANLRGYTLWSGQGDQCNNWWWKWQVDTCSFIRVTGNSQDTDVHPQQPSTISEKLKIQQWHSSSKDRSMYVVKNTPYKSPLQNTLLFPQEDDLTCSLKNILVWKLLPACKMLLLPYSTEPNGYKFKYPCACVLHDQSATGQDGRH